MIFDVLFSFKNLVISIYIYVKHSNALLHIDFKVYIYTYQLKKIYFHIYIINYRLVYRSEVYYLTFSHVSNIVVLLLHTKSCITVVILYSCIV